MPFWLAVVYWWCWFWLVDEHFLNTPTNQPRNKSSSFLHSLPSPSPSLPFAMSKNDSSCRHAIIRLEWLMNESLKVFLSLYFNLFKQISYLEYSNRKLSWLHSHTSTIKIPSFFFRLFSCLRLSLVFCLPSFVSD